MSNDLNPGPDPVPDPPKSGPNARRAAPDTKAKSVRRAKPAPKAKAKRPTPIGGGSRSTKSTGEPPAGVRPSAATKRARASQRPPTSPPPTIKSPDSAELLSAAIQSAGELAAIGIRFATEAIRAAASRIPKP